MPTVPHRVLRVLTRLNVGGPSSHAALLSTRLESQQFTTCLAVGEPDPTEGDLSDRVQDRGVRLVRIRGLRRPIRPLADAGALVRLVRLVWRERPQLLHTHMAKAGAIGRMAGFLYNALGPGRRLGLRAILIHTFHGHVLEGYFPRWQSRLFLGIECWLARRTDCLIAVSPAIQHQLCALGIGRPDQWRVIPLGLDLSALARLPLPEGSTRLRLGLVGRLVPIKNPGLFLESLRRFTGRRGRTVEAVIVGDGPLRGTLERQTQALGLQPVVRFTGWQYDLRSVYHGLDVACLTSWNEGTPVALIEAMAAGRAVIATQVGGVSDLLDSDQRPVGEVPHGTFRVTERGILVAPGDAEGLAEAMAAVEADIGLRRRLGEAARAYVMERFGAERLVRDITALYEELCGIIH